jgi:hypothetical protein
VVVPLLAVAALAGDRPNVRDLDRTTIPAGLEYHRGQERLMIDGELVRGSRREQLEWLGDVAAASGMRVEDLRIEERERALHRRSVGAAVVVGAPVVAITATLIFPPLAAAWVPVAVGTLGAQGVGLATALPAHREFDRDGLAEQVERLAPFPGL